MGSPASRGGRALAFTIIGTKSNLRLHVFMFDWLCLAVRYMLPQQEELPQPCMLLGIMNDAARKNFRNCGFQVASKTSIRCYEVDGCFFCKPPAPGLCPRGQKMQARHKKKMSTFAPHERLCSRQAHRCKFVQVSTLLSDTRTRMVGLASRLQHRQLRGGV